MTISPLVPSHPVSNVPSTFTTTSSLSVQDHVSHPTETSGTQEETVASVLPYLTGTLDGVRPAFNSHGLPRLDRANHIEFAKDNLDKMPSQMTGYDAARPWFGYWVGAALALLGGLEGGERRELRDRAIDTFSSQQLPTGGFGGSHGHLAHLAPSYAAVLSLAILSSQDDDVDTLGLVDRKALWEWLGEIKQADGGFRVCVGGEEDVRGAYCAMTIISLLNLPPELPPNAPTRREAGFTSFTDGLKDWLRRCQTYEGGISGQPDSEAHGAYAFCVLGCLSILGDPRVTIPEVLDVDLLLSWLSSRQYAPEGGFSGRTNKLVDACYSHWVGGCWPLLEAAVFRGQQNSEGRMPTFTQSASTALYNREGLIRYIICCCQAEDGGLRDKPGRYPDAYHTCYTAAGLSSALYYNAFEPLEGNDGTNIRCPAPFGWRSAGPSKEQEIVSEGDVIEPVHPVFVIPFEAVYRARERFRESAWR